MTHKENMIIPNVTKFTELCIPGFRRLHSPIDSDLQQLLGHEGSSGSVDLDVLGCGEGDLTLGTGTSD